jgi:hypothetical protein
MYLKRDYKTYIVNEIPSVWTWEIEINLWINPDSDSWYLLLEPWTPNEESMYYHRSQWNIVYVYQINRTNPVTHLSHTPCLLANSIDYINHLLTQTNRQLHIYKKNNNHLVCKWWTFYIGAQNIELDDLDTELWLPNKIFTNHSINYIYIYENDFIITTTKIEKEAYLIATVFIWISWSIDSFIKHNTYIVGNKWDKWDTGDIWPQGDKWDTGDIWPIWLTWPQGIQW